MAQIKSASCIQVRNDSAAVRDFHTIGQIPWDRTLTPHGKSSPFGIEVPESGVDFRMRPKAHRRIVTPALSNAEVISRD
jgi:hypothetical protein